MGVRNLVGQKIKIGSRIVEIEKVIMISQFEKILKLETGEILHTDFKQEAKLVSG